MRKLIFAINLSLDGCCDHTKFSGNDEMFEYHTNLMRGVDLFIYGRKTYQLMVPFWPDVAKNQSMSKAANEFAQALTAINKVVFSKTLESSAEEKNTRIVGARLRDEILKLKEKQGGDILTGGVSIPSQLIELGLVDEYHFLIHPVVVGEGRRLLEGISIAEKLQLAETKNFKSGVVALRYLKM